MHMVTRKQVKRKKVAKACSEFLTGGKGFFGAPLSATTLFSGKKVHRLLTPMKSTLCTPLDPGKCFRRGDSFRTSCSSDSSPHAAQSGPFFCPWEGHSRHSMDSGTHKNRQKMRILAMLGTFLLISKIQLPLLLSTPSPFSTFLSTHHSLNPSHTSQKHRGQVWGYTRIAGISGQKWT